MSSAKVWAEANNIKYWKFIEKKMLNRIRPTIDQCKIPEFKNTLNMVYNDTLFSTF